MRLGQTSVIYFVSQVAASVIGFFATIYFTRTLGENTYGYFILTLSLVSWFGIIKSVGFGSAVIKRMSEGEEPDEYLAAGFIIKFILTSIIIIGVFLFQDSINSYVGAPVSIFIIFLLSSSILLNLLTSALQGTHRVQYYALLSTGKQISRSGIMILLVFLGWGLTGMLTGRVAGTILIILVGLWIIRPTLVMPERKHFYNLFNFAKFAWLGNMRKRTFSDADILVLGLFVSSGLVGIYAVAYSLSKFLNIFANAIKTTLFPEMSKLSAEKDTDTVGVLTTDALTFSGLFMIPGVVGAAIIGDRLMRIYGPGFERGSTVLVILLLGILAYTYNKQLLNTLNAIDRPDLAFRTNLIFISVNILLNLLLVWQFGWTGAAVATAISATVGLLLSYYYVNKHIPVVIPYEEIARQCISAFLMGFIVYLSLFIGEITFVITSEHNTVFAAVLVGIGGFVYFSIYSAISSQFREVILANLPSSRFSIVK